METIPFRRSLPTIELIEAETLLGEEALIKMTIICTERNTYHRFMARQAKIAAKITVGGGGRSQIQCELK